MTNTPNPKSVSHLLHENRTFSPTEKSQKRSHLKNFATYEKMYQESIHHSDSFWLKQAASLDWMTPPKKACEYTWDTTRRVINHAWFEDGQINLTINCL